MGRTEKKDSAPANETRGNQQLKRNARPPKQPAPKRNNSTPSDAAPPGLLVPELQVPASIGAPEPRVPASSVSPHGAAAFLNSRPHPRALPAPPAKFFLPRPKLPSLVRQQSASRAGPGRVVLEHQPIVASIASSASSYGSPALQHLHGTMLHARLALHLPDLATKITGMLLELEPAEVSSLLIDHRRFGEYVDDALDVLRAAGDVRALEVPMGSGVEALVLDGVARPTLAVMVPDAAELAPQSDSGLTPEQAAIGLRMSPRYSLNPYSSTNLLSSVVQAGGSL